jgi:NAD(P)H dehydrogenase (quinone)
MANLTVVYYSLTGNTFRVAQAVEEGARAAGAQTRLRRVRETLPGDALAGNAAHQAYAKAAGNVGEATLDDLDWADGILLGSPTRYGALAGQMKSFLDSTGPLWGQGKLANKAVAAFTGAQNPHGGQETTLLTIYNVMYHWGAVITPPGYTDQSVFAAGGNPYGVSFTASSDGNPSQEVLAAARYMGGRVARFAAVLADNRSRLSAQ